MTVLDLATAQAIIAAARKGPRSDPPRPVAVAVSDTGGHVVALEREDGAPPLLAHIAMAKAFTCVVYGQPTTELGAIADAYPIWFHGIARVAETSMGQPLIGSKGGLFIRARDGRVLGAVGVAGETGENDDQMARAGVTAVGFTD
jgi:uncharacterized protein GlcG (DUF336 family)